MDAKAAAELLTVIRSKREQLSDEDATGAISDILYEFGCSIKEEMRTEFSLRIDQLEAELTAQMSNLTPAPTVIQTRGGITLPNFTITESAGITGIKTGYAAGKMF